MKDYVVLKASVLTSPPYWVGKADLMVGGPSRQSLIWKKCSLAMSCRPVPKSQSQTLAELIRGTWSELWELICATLSQNKTEKVNLDLPLKPLIPTEAREFMQVIEGITCIPSCENKRHQDQTQMPPSGFSQSCPVYRGKIKEGMNNPCLIPGDFASTGLMHGLRQPSPDRREVHLSANLEVFSVVCYSFCSPVAPVPQE